MSASERQGVNRHTTRRTPRIRGLVSGWGLKNTEVIAALWVHVALEKILLFTCRWFDCTAYAVNQSRINT